MSELESKLNMYRTIQKEIGKVQSSISSAGTQILENEMVIKVRTCPSRRQPCGNRCETCGGGRLEARQSWGCRAHSSALVLACQTLDRPTPRLSRHARSWTSSRRTLPTIETR